MSVKYKIRDQQGLNFLTFTICGWVDLFSHAEFRDIILDSWRYCSEPKGLQIWAYVIMSNHIHVIANTKPPWFVVFAGTAGADSKTQLVPA